jgi:rubrerythrin
MYQEVKIMELKGSQTEKNLLAAFAGESQARNRYTFFASVAKKEGYEQISAIFQETADNEKEHAQLFFNHLKGGNVEITAAYPAGITGTTAENLKAAAEGEKLEWGTLYPNFAEIAEKEGFEDVATTFRSIARVESYHERRYRKLLANVEQGKVFKKDSPIMWKCRNCGHVFEGTEAPDKCPVCHHERSYFEVWCENY